MTARFYLARLGSGSEEIVVAAIRWPIDQGPIIPLGWLVRLTVLSEVDVAFRLNLSSNSKSATLLLTAPTLYENRVQETLHALQEAPDRPAIMQIPIGPAEFDDIACVLPPIKRRLKQEGLQIQGQPVGEKSSLWPTILKSHSMGTITWQFNLCHWQPDAEVRKLIKRRDYWWREESPFSVVTQQTQAVQLSALENSGWISSETFACHSERELNLWQAAFNANHTGMIVTNDDDIDELMSFGLHPWKWNKESFSLEALAASYLSSEELEQISQTQFAPPVKPSQKDDNTSPAASKNNGRERSRKVEKSPLRVFIDLTSPLKAEGKGDIVWVIANDSQEEFCEIRIAPHISKQLSGVGFLHSLPPGCRCDIVQPADLSQNNETHLIFCLNMEAITQSGNKFLIHRPEAIRFSDIPTKGQKRKLTILGANVLLDKSDVSAFDEVYIRPEDGAFIGNTAFSGRGDVTIEAKGNVTLGNSTKPNKNDEVISVRHKLALHGRHDEDLAEVTGFHVEVIEPTSQV